MANRNSNDYNDQDYPHYYDRDDRYDSQSEGRDSKRLRNEQRNRSGSGRENTQGGAYDYNQSETRRYETNSGSGGENPRSNPRDYDDFASTNRSSRNYDNQSRRTSRDDRGGYTLYGYERDQRQGDRSGDSGGSGERTGNYQNQDYNFSGGSYARSNDRQQQDREHGGSSRYYGGQNEQNYSNQNFGRANYDRNQSKQNFYNRDGNYTGSSESGYNYQQRDNQSQERNQDSQERGWWERTTDEVASWFGDDEAGRRRAEDSRAGDYNQFEKGGQQTSHRGRGPKNYRRSDERIKEDISDRLTDYPYLDASDIEIEVNSGGEVILTGMVESRYAKRMAEDIAENVSGVTHLENRLRVKPANNQAGYSSSVSSTISSETPKESSNTFGDKNYDASDTSGTYGSREDLAANYSNQGLSQTSPIGKPATGDLSGSTNASTNETSSFGDKSDVGVMASPSLTGTSVNNSTLDDDPDSFTASSGK